MVINAPFGPESDAYAPETRLGAEEAAEYHAWQAGVIAGTEADLITGLTITYVEEAIGIVRAATAAGMPAAMSFTVETDGRLPTDSRSPRRSSRSTPRRTGLRRTSWSTAPTRNTSPPCRDPDREGTACSASAPTLPRRATRADESEELDDGDPEDLARRYRQIGERLPHLTVLGGCCGTDHRHVACVADAWLAAG